ncbi:MAG TPA: hypothetical protein VE131_10405 [Terriglobales bacterium]|nr:hypothetical protein [Terriglobales bacterium]
MKKEVFGSFALVFLLSLTGYSAAQSHGGSMMGGASQNGSLQQMGPGMGSGSMGSGMMGSGMGSGIMGSMSQWLGSMGGMFGSGTDETRVAANQQLARSQSGGGVMITATYLNPRSNDEAKFDVALNTHSVDLDGYDLKALSVLRDDAGKEVKPLRVESEGGGHHRRVTLVFPKPSVKAKKLELVIKDIAGVKARSFSWDLQQ